MPTRLIIKGGSVVDGTGAEPRMANVFVEAGRVVAVGHVDVPADVVLDASGRTVTPGFIDIHTHYDAQLCWDGLCHPSPLHGVTTVVTGNCSLSMAPIGEAGREKVTRLFQQIEDFHQEDIAAGVPWSWESFPEYMRHIAKGLGVNVAPLVGHSTLRLHVMGEAAQQREATADETARMVAELEGAMAAGAAGISFSHLDNDEEMRPVPSRFASLEEKEALVQVLARAGRGVFQTVPNFLTVAGQLEAVKELAELSRRTGVTATFGPLVDVPQIPALLADTLAALDEAAATGAKVLGQTSPRPFDMHLRLDESFFMGSLMPAWMAALRLPVPERLAAFADLSRRVALVMEGYILAPLLEYAYVEETFSLKNSRLRGRRVADIARERGDHLPNTLIEIALVDRLRTHFVIRGGWHANEATVAGLLRHPHIQIGASDAGAHCSQVCGAGDTTYLLSRFVRERGDLSLVEAVRRLTSEPAATWGLTDRGVIRPGAHADLLILDLPAVGRGDEFLVKDLPGGGERFVRTATGIDHVIINGVPVVAHGTYTTARPGMIAC